MKHLSAERFAQMRSLFEELLDTDAQGRRARLAELGASDEELARLVRGLLEDADASSSGEAEPAAPAGAVRLTPGSLVAGRYRIQSTLGEGGMGEVYLAARIDGITQQVAIKIVHGGTAFLADRFVRERQILARLSHPNIARFLDGGLTESGMPWLAMEYVDGPAITVACDRDRLDLPARVRRFVQLCGAVQFAHRNLVLHRDIKPTNILVDGEGTPKLLDFGIARLIEEKPSERTQTFMMTPAYAAPEQLRGDEATTASDIFQLGLVLCELLSGLSAREFRHGGRTAGTEAATLTQAFARHAASSRAEIARARNSDDARLVRALRGDLDRIIAKATAEDPRERYETVQMFGEDLERWLGGRPVLAQQGSFAYRFGKLVRRHRIATAAIAVLAAGLLASTGYALYRAHRESLQRQRAETAFNFIRDVFEQGDPQTNSGKEIAATELFRRAVGTLDARTDIDPVTRATLLTDIARIFQQFNHAPDARLCADRALAVLEPLRESHPAEYFEALRARLWASEDSKEIIQKIALAMPFFEARPAAVEEGLAYLLWFRGYNEYLLGQFTEAERDLRAAIDQYGPDASGREATNALSSLALLVAERGDFRGALTLLQRVVDTAEKKQKQFMLLSARYNLGVIQLAAGDAPAAIRTLDPQLAPCEQFLGTHKLCHDIGTMLVRAYVSAADYSRAQALLEQSRAKTPPPDVQGDDGRLADAQVEARMALARLAPERAQATLRAALEKMPTPPAGMRRVRIDYVLAESLVQMGRCAEAEPMLVQVENTAKTLFGDRPAAYAAEAEDSLGRCDLQRGEASGAREHFSRAVEEFERALGANSPSRMRSEIHRRWSEFLLTRDPAQLDRLADCRAWLVSSLGGEEKPQVWQFDLLLAGLSRQAGQKDRDPVRVAHAEAGLKALAGAPDVPHFLGLNSFSP